MTPLRVLGLLVALLAAACTREPPASARDLAGDLLAYVEALGEWEVREKEIFQALAEVEKTHYVDDDFVIRRFKAILPRVRRHRTALAVYEPRTNELREVHERYKVGWEDLEAGFDEVIATMEAKNYIHLAKAKNRVEEGRRRLLQAFQSLDTLLVEIEPEVDRLRKERTKTAGAGA